MFKNNMKKLTYGIRKLTLGAVPVVLGATILTTPLINNGLVKAESKATSMESNVAQDLDIRVIEKDGATGVLEVRAKRDLENVNAKIVVDNNKAQAIELKGQSLKAGQVYNFNFSVENGVQHKNLPNTGVVKKHTTVSSKIGNHTVDITVSYLVEDSSDNKIEEPKKPEVKPEEPKQPEVKPEEPKQPEVKPEEPKQPEVKPEESKQPEVKPEEPKQPEVKPEEPKKPEVKPEEPKKPEVKPEEPKKPEVKPEEPKKPEVKPEEPKQPEVKPEEPKKPEVKPEEPKKPEVKPEEPKKPEVKPEEPKKPEVKPEEPKKPEVKPEEPKKPEVKPEEPKQPEVKPEEPKIKEEIPNDFPNIELPEAKIGFVEEKETENINFETIYEEDVTLLSGTEQEKVAGVVGQKEITKKYKTINGEKVGQPEISERIVKEKVDRVVKRGVSLELITKILDKRKEFTDLLDNIAKSEDQYTPESYAEYKEQANRFSELAVKYFKEGDGIGRTTEQLENLFNDIEKSMKELKELVAKLEKKGSFTEKKEEVLEKNKRLGNLIQDISQNKTTYRPSTYAKVEKFIKERVVYIEQINDPKVTKEQLEDISIKLEQSMKELQTILAGLEKNQIKKNLEKVQ